MPLMAASNSLKNRSKYPKLNKNFSNTVARKQEGLVEGIVEGKEQVAQAAFNKGYEVAFKHVYQLNQLKGVVR